MTLQSPTQSAGAAVIKDSSSSIKIETINEAETAIDANAIAHGIAPAERIRGTVKGIEDERVLLLSRLDSVQVMPHIYKFISRSDPCRCFLFVILLVTPQFSCCHSEQLSLMIKKLCSVLMLCKTMYFIAFIEQMIYDVVIEISSLLISD